VLTTALLTVLISGIVSLLVARVTAQATIRTAQIGAGVEQDKLAHEKQQAAVEDFVQAGVLMGKLALKAARADVRAQFAADARQSLLRVEFILGSWQDPKFEELLRLLQQRSEEHLDRALAMWPDVEKGLRRHFSA